MRWTGSITPSELSRSYLVRIDYVCGRHPKTNVLKPGLQKNDRGLLPHVYRDGSLCLYDIGQWNESLLLVDTIVPWTSEWLYYYEIWLGSDRWYGDDEDPQSSACFPDIAPPTY